MKRFYPFLCLVALVFSIQILQAQVPAQTGRVIELDTPDQITVPNEIVKEYRASERISLKPNDGNVAGYSTTLTPGQRISHIIDPTVIDKTPITSISSCELINENDWTNGINRQLPVGAVNGMHNVSGTGGAVYNIPINVAPGIGKMIPNLSITYNSQGGNGLLGMGWSLAGLSAVSRVGQKIDTDGERSPINCFDDRFSLDGNLLVFDEDDDEKKYYKAENRLFAEIIKNSNTESFTVLYKNGLKYTYGGNADARVLCSSGKTLRWLISRVEDLDGNYMTYHYNNDDKEKFISEIKYTGNGSLQPLNVIRFLYQERTDKREYYETGKLFENSILLSKIAVYNNGKTYRTYDFDFVTRGYSYLKSVTEILPDGKALNPTIFEYGNCNSNSVEHNPVGINRSGVDNKINWVFYPGDFNGDGLSDFLGLEYVTESFQNQNNQTAYNGKYIAWSIFYNTGQGFTEVPITFDNDLIGDNGEYRKGSSGQKIESFLPDSYFPVLGHQFMFGDINGDGKDDIILARLGEYNPPGGSVFEPNYTNDYWYYGCYFSNPNNNTFTPSTAGTAKLPANNGTTGFYGHEVTLADFDGDGRKEFFGINNETTEWFITSFRTATESHRVLIQNDGNTIYPTRIYNQSSPVTYSRLITTDYDGDGKNELIWDNWGSGYDPDGDGVSDGFKIFIDIDTRLENGKSTLVKKPTYNQSIVKLTAWEQFYRLSTNRFNYATVDFNADGKQDLFMKYSDLNVPAEKWISRGAILGEEFAINSYEKSQIDETGIRVETGRIRVFNLDLNANGLTDVISVERRADNTGINFTFFYNTGKGNFESESAEVDFVIDENTHYSIGDFDGDGNVEFAIENHTFCCQDFLKLNSKYGSEERLLSAVKNGFQNEVSFDYGTLAQSKTNYTNSNGDNYPIVALKGGAIQVVNKLKEKQYLTGNIQESRYRYADGLIDYTGYGFLGFAEMEVVTVLNESDDENAPKATRTISTKELVAKSLIPFGVTTIQAGIQTGQTYYTYKAKQYESGYKKQWFYYLDNTISARFEPSYGTLLSSIAQDNIYDELNGNLTKEVVRNSVTRKTTSYTYEDASSNPAIYDASLPKKIITTYEDLAGLANDYTTRVLNTYENGKVKTSTNFCDVGWQPDDKHSLTTTNVYNEFGLPIQTNVYAHDGSGTRTNYAKYDDKGRFVTEKKNALGHTVNYSDFDLYGNPRVITGVNGLITKLTYNNLGQQIKSEDATGVVTITNYTWVDGHPEYDAEALYSVSTNTLGIADETIGYFDALGRNIHTWTTEFSGNTTKQSTKYNKQGLVEYETLPYQVGTADGAKRTSYEYDDYNRVFKITYPYDTYTTYRYEGLKSYVNNSWEAAESYTEMNTAGQVLTQNDRGNNDRGNNISYTYFPHGGVKTITTAAKVIENDYDLVTAQQISLDDPDAGTMTYKYNAFGELKKQIDFNSNEVEIDQRDALGRILHKKERVMAKPYTHYTYVYDQGDMAKGKLVSVSNGEHTIESSFDTFGRLQEKRETALGQQYVYNYTYDAYNRLEEKTYPTGLQVRNQYNNQGFKTAMYLNDLVDPVWEVKGADNPYDELGRIKMGYIYGKATEYTYKDDFLHTQKTAGIHEREYTFENGTGNLKERRDLLKGLSETFEYDEYDRLLYGDVLKDGENTSYLSTYTDYDTQGMGNVAYKEGVGEFMYNDPNNVKHRVSGIKNVEFSADKAVFNQTIKYNAFNSTREIAQGNNTLSLEYGIDQQRIYTELNDASGILKKKTFLTGFEIIESNGETKYVHPLGNILAIKNDQGEWTYFALYKDHLGSIEVITDINGTIVQEQSFDAWGNRRDPNTWLAYIASTSIPELFVDRGYTGHEHLEEFGLINMNGRVYDPLLGMMLSPDNYTQDATNFLNYNRYSYCLNNPLKYTDPSGELIWVIPNISWSKEGGLGIGVSVVFGVPGGLSAQVGAGYNFKSNDLYGYAGATAAFNTVYVSAGTQSGFNAGYTVGATPFSGLPISTNFFSAGVNYNFNSGNVTGNVSAWGVDQNGNTTFNPSVSAMILPEHTTNLVRGQGFRSNNRVLSRFVDAGNQQGALDYFGFEGTYRESKPEGGDYVEGNDYYGSTKPSNGEISYGRLSFESYDVLYNTYVKESYHSARFKSGKSPETVDYPPGSKYYPEEARGYQYAFKRSGLYSNSTIENFNNANSYWGQSMGNVLIQNRITNFIYKIPRLW